MKFLLAACALLSLTATGAGAAAADAYPSKPIRMIVAYTAGGPVDITARAIGPKLSEALGQPVVIDNRAGGSGLIATDLVAKSAPDGYTVLVCSAGNTINASFNPNLPYDWLRDFAPVTEVAIITSILVIHPGVPAHSVKELIALARAKPGQLTYASTGNGTPAHLAAELFKTMAGVDIVHVPYKGGAPAAIDLMGGQVQLSFLSAPAVMPHIKSGRLTALAVTNSKRSALLPQLPTIGEAGLPGYESEGWHGICAPVRTPKPIIDRLYREISTIVKLPQVSAYLASGGAETVDVPPDRFGAMMRAEVSKWAKLVKAAGMKID
jgi:tripartite-type tricarboxylate transporter receptor subunit TctC